MAISNEEVVVRYRLEVDQLTKELDAIILKQEEIVKTEKAVTVEGKKQISSEQFAAQKRKQLISAEAAEIRKLGQLRKLAFDPKLIDDYNKRIEASRKNISTLKGEVSGFSKSATSLFAGIGAGIAAAFSIQAVIAFGKASINAFLEAEKNANKLRFAITAIGGESEPVFERLLEQSNELQKITIFSDDSIQSAQAALSAFGLTGAEIENLIPKLANFATVSQKTIEEAAQAVGQGLQGAGREFKKYNIEVSATASKQENLNRILSGFDQFADAASNATKTLTGQLEQATNRADELQENIGEKLAPSFVRARLAALEFAEDAIDFFLNTDKAVIKLLKTLGLFPAEIAEIKTTFKGFTQEILAQVDATKSLSEFDEAALKIRNDQTAAIAKQQAVVDRLEEAKETALSREIVNLEEVRAINQAIAKQQSTNLQNEINKLNIIEDILIKQRVVKEKSLKGELGDADKLEELRKKELAEIEKNQQLLRKLEIQNLEDLKQQRIAVFEEETKALTAKGELRSKIIRELEKQLVKDLNKIDLQRDVDPLFKVPEIEVPNFDQKITPQIEVVNDKLIPLLILPRVDSTEFDDSIEKVEAKTLEGWIANNEDILDATTQLLGSIAFLYSVFTNARIEEINRETNAQLEALDLQSEAIDSNLSKRRISEKEAERQHDELAKRRIRTEEKAAKEIRKIKRQQAILDKAAAAFDIILSTARNVASAKNPALKILYLALGAAQLAIVAAQPIPYKKGSKNTRSGLARVDEEGPELIMRNKPGRITTLERGSKVVPFQNTQKHRSAIDAMFDNRFEQYIMKEYVMPRLIAQKQEQVKQQDQSFAKNLADSLTVNVAAPMARKLENVKMTNVEELAQAIVRQSRQSPYRR